MGKNKNQKSAGFRVALVIVCVAFLVLIVNENITINSLKKEQAEYIAKVDAIDRAIERIQIEYAEPITDETMRRLARETLGFYLSNEIIYEVS